MNQKKNKNRSIEMIIDTKQYKKKTIEESLKLVKCR